MGSPHQTTTLRSRARSQTGGCAWRLARAANSSYAPWMGAKPRGGMWCDYCDQPIVGQKATHRARNTIAGLLALPTTGVSLLGARVEGFHCPTCGSPVRSATAEDYRRLDLEPLVAERQARLAAEAADRQRERAEAWREDPLDAVVPWRRKDRERLEAAGAAEKAARSSAQAPDVAERLRQLAELHAAGALTDAEFSAAKTRLLRGE
jgi:hypothetical protein